MDKIQELTAALDDLRRAQASAKLFFYSDRSAGGMRHGHVAVHAEGRCLIDFEGLGLDQAVAELLQLQVGRIVVLPNAGLGAAPVAARTIGVEALLDRLRSGLDSGGPLLVAGGAAAPPGSVLVSTPQPAPAPPSAAKQHMPVALVSAALGVLEEYFGGAATRRVDALVERFPPDRLPGEFLDAAEELLGGMVGGRKAAEAFLDVRKRLSAGR